MNTGNELWADSKLRLVVTSECNINCFYCHNEGQPKDTKYISDGLFARVTELVRYNPPANITITGGEPLLHPDLERLIKQLRPHCSKITLVSNCLLMTDMRMNALAAAGLNKIRVGVDSFRRSKSRPTSGPPQANNILTIIESLLKRNFSLELNIVLTKFNQDEITDMMLWCAHNKVSAKVFEHVHVLKYGTLSSRGEMKESPVISFEEWRSCLRKTGTIISESEPLEYKGANHVFDGVGFQIRYCRYLCPFGLCFKTGTRIDATGLVYVCMERPFVTRIVETEPFRQIVSKVLHADARGRCASSGA